MGKPKINIKFELNKLGLIDVTEVDIFILTLFMIT
jgi:hypothetical protein